LRHCQYYQLVVNAEPQVSGPLPLGHLPQEMG
jgi:hypothetical protein